MSDSATNLAPASTQLTAADLAPKGFLPDANSPFFMSTGDYTNLQCYLDAAAHLPLTTDDLVSRLSISTEDATKFQDLLDAYGSVNTHCADFKTNTLTPMITLAVDIANYGDDAVSTYYPALLQVITAWQNKTMTASVAKAKFLELLKVLRDAAADNAAKAVDMQKKVIAFEGQTKDDQNVLTPLQTSYNTKLGDQGGEISRLTQSIQDTSDEIDHWNSEYNRDVTIACTTTTYVWIFPYGMIAAAIVAGIYGSRAQDALDNVHKYREELEALQQEKQKDVILLADLNIASKSVSGLLDTIKSALLVLQKMETIWGSLATDIDTILASLVNEDTVPVVVRGMVTQTVIDQWSMVAKEARNFVVNAYVTFAPEDEVTANPDQYAVPQAPAGSDPLSSLPSGLLG